MKPRPSVTHVYVAAEGRRRKIGVTSNVASRIKMLTTVERKPVKLIREWHCAEDAQSVEWVAKDLLSDHLIHSEWFRATTEQAIAAVEQAIIIVKNKDYERFRGRWKIPKKFRPPPRRQRKTYEQLWDDLNAELRRTLPPEAFEVSKK